MPQRCFIEVVSELLTITDASPRPKANKKLYDVISPAHIPAIMVTIKVSEKHESLALQLPAFVTDMLPALRHDTYNEERRAPGTLRPDF